MDINNEEKEKTSISSFLDNQLAQEMMKEEKDVSDITTHPSIYRANMKPDSLASGKNLLIGATPMLLSMVLGNQGDGAKRSADYFTSLAAANEKRNSALGSRLTSADKPSIRRIRRKDGSFGFAQINPVTGEAKEVKGVDAPGLSLGEFRERKVIGKEEKFGDRQLPEQVQKRLMELPKELSTNKQMVAALDQLALADDSISLVESGNPVQLAGAAKLIAGALESGKLTDKDVEIVSGPYSLRGLVEDILTRNATDIPADFQRRLLIQFAEELTNKNARKANEIRDTYINRESVNLKIPRKTLRKRLELPYLDTREVRKVRDVRDIDLKPSQLRKARNPRKKKVSEGGMSKEVSSGSGLSKEDLNFILGK